jgi:para-nitrobenzyl esterase
LVDVELGLIKTEVRDKQGDEMSKANSRDGIILNRREALWLSATTGLGIALGRKAMASDSIKTGAHQQEPGTCSTPRSAVSKTKYGPVRGYLDGGVFTFKGVPYGQNTAGENRWLPAKPPMPWKDEYPALVYGANCPQTLHDWTGNEQTFLQDWDDGWQSEDMLKLNIWTPSLSGSRPVMFYIHGGGFQFGSSYELPSHEGAQMARHHDVVQISVNHRLNGLGFLDVSEIGGAGYEDSVSVGMSDLVAALKWVQENIANFGGDPNKVMIYGQSGGGGKVATLMGMPSAKGLFHRAAIQSGGSFAADKEEAREFGRMLVKQLGVQPNDMGALQKLDWATLNAACDAAQAKMPRRPGPFGAMPGPPRRFWMPTVDGRVITENTFQNSAPQISKDVPLMIGSVSEEGNSMRSRPTEDQWRANLKKAYGEAKGQALADAMKNAHPEKSVRTLSYMCGGGGILNAVSIRNSVVNLAKMKHDLKAAPVYTYYFSWQSPMLEDAGAWHTADLAFCFDNTKRCEQGTGNTPEAQALAKKMATAWANFARTGDPSQPGLTWTPSDPEHNQTMVWDNQCRMVNDPEGEIRKIILS